MQPAKVVIAPDSFKESLNAAAAAQAIQRGLIHVWPNTAYELVPMADGGEGTVRSLVAATGGKIIAQTVTGALGEPVAGFFGMLGDKKTAVIEMAAAAGLESIPPQARNPREATTFGVGELIRAALDAGARRILLGLGGSATNDGGCGMACALGVKLLDGNGHPLDKGGAALLSLEKIDLSGLDPRIAQTSFEIATDVDSPLTGSNGASAIFGPQKGASAEDVRLLDRALCRFADVAARELHRDIDRIPGAGAAGGLGAGALLFLNGTIRPGVDLIVRETGLEEKMKGASLVVTGEGKIDGQTAYGKTPVGVARIAAKKHIPVVALAGMLAAGCESVYHCGIDALFSIVPGAVSLKEALADADKNLQRTSENIARLLSAIKS
ncbi:MAG: glycerate kinase [Sporolactobacillus sp.]|nr:glycerate kinase [Sporolactobacillus sp.]